VTMSTSPSYVRACRPAAGGHPCARAFSPTHCLLDEHTLYDPDHDEHREASMKGRVAVLPAYGGKFELREYPVPDPEPGAILVKLTRAGVCGSHLPLWRGEAA